MEVFKVAKDSTPEKVAGALAERVRQGEFPELQAVGPQATMVAVQAVAIAHGYVEKNGIDLICTPAFIDETIPVEERRLVRLICEAR